MPPSIPLPSIQLPIIFLHTASISVPPDQKGRGLEEEICNQEAQQAKCSYDLEGYTLLLLDVLGNVIDHLV
jgi:hypothetical protein